MSMCTASTCTCKVACGTLHSTSSRGIHRCLTASSLVLGAVAGREGKGLTGRGDVQLEGEHARLVEIVPLTTVLAVRGSVVGSG